MANMTADLIREPVEKGRKIYLIKTQSYSYYIIIPIKQQVRVLLDIRENVSVDKIIETPVLNDMAVLVPVINEGIFNYLKAPQNSYSQGTDYFSAILSNASGLLRHNRKVVELVALFNNNDSISNFINYFVSNFPNVIQKSDRDLLRGEIVGSVVNNASMMNQGVVGADVPLVDPNAAVYNEPAKEVTNESTTNKNGEPGFVSYVLLGVVIAIVSLVFLYMLI